MVIIVWKGNIFLFNDTLSTFYLGKIIHLCQRRPSLRMHSSHLLLAIIGRKEGRKEMFYLTTHSAHFIYGYMASDIWKRTTQIAREEICCRHMGYSFLISSKGLLYASSNRQDNTYQGLCYTSRGALAGTRNSSMGPPWRIDPTTYHCLYLFSCLYFMLGSSIMPWVHTSAIWTV